MDNYRFKPTYKVNEAKYEKEQLTGDLKDDIDPKQIIDNTGVFQDAFVQNLICINKNTYMLVSLANNKFSLEFTPNNIGSKSIYAYSNEKAKPYSFNVNLIDKQKSKRTFLFEMHCKVNSNFSMLNSNNKPRKTEKLNITYKFGNSEIISEQYFKLSDDDKEYLKESFPDKLVMISLVNFYLTNVMVEKYTEKYNLTQYTIFDFIELESFGETQIEKQHLEIINPLLNRPLGNQYYYRDPFVHRESLDDTFDTMRRMLYTLNPTPSILGHNTPGIEPVYDRYYNRMKKINPAAPAPMDNEEKENEEEDDKPTDRLGSVFIDMESGGMIGEYGVKYIDMNELADNEDQEEDDTQDERED